MKSNKDDLVFDASASWTQPRLGGGRQIHRVPPTRTAAPAVAPAVGEMMAGQYLVMEKLGMGGMGIVLKAHDANLDREVAIKIIHPELTARPDIEALFKAEARAMARVRHPNVVEIYAFGTHEGLNFFVMEFVPGEDLDAWGAERERRFAIDETVGLLEQVCRGVQAIHDEGAIHRDLKPSNILIGPAFLAKVADFGLASRLGSKAAHAGTPEFMAPEVVSGLDLPDLAPRADVYALAVIAYEMLTGCSPFVGETVEAVLAAQLNEQPRPPSELRPELPAAFDPVIARALAKDPRVRTASAEQFRRELIAARSARPTTAPAARVALVEDDEDFALWLVDVLRDKLPYVEIEHFTNGDAAIRGIETGNYALAILDLDLPGANGVELCASIRGNRHLADLPVVVCTGVGGPPEWKLLRQIGADGFLVKPMDSDEIVACVRRLLNRGRQAGQSATGRASSDRTAAR